MGEYRFPASQVSCPAFGGPDNRHLYVTTAAEGLTAEQIAGEQAGQVFVTQTECSGKPEPQVIL
ncbi:hypothetical protein FJM67_09005 [Maribrevibacterium harenarium]|uniref:SMP-30/Gluconolactonase/LRE-like region domain-containing protein n=1 Tax=Maribrevibacterium harenarium TaxID=2589817 RepID=A0A501WQG9_9GAMM|nr:hypothetical protein FJM67_09005 [Maribrevibacterium harenarium]